MSEKSTKPALSVESKPDEIETYRQSLVPTTRTRVIPYIIAWIAVLAAGMVAIALAF